MSRSRRNKGDSKNKYGNPVFAKVVYSFSVVLRAALQFWFADDAYRVCRYMSKQRSETDNVMSPVNKYVLFPPPPKSST